MSRQAFILIVDACIHQHWLLTHAIAQNAITQLDSINGMPHPLMSARFVSGVPENTSRMQYPTWRMYIPTM